MRSALWKEKHVEHAGTSKRHIKPSNNTTWTVLAHGYWWQTKDEGLVIAVLAGCRLDEWCIEKYKGTVFPFSCFPSLNERWRATKPGSEHVVYSMIRGRYHGGRRQSSDDSLRSPTVIPPTALDKPSIMKRYHRRRTTRWGVTARLATMVTLHDGGMMVGLWKLSSFDGRRPPWYRPQILAQHAQFALARPLPGLGGRS